MATEIPFEDAELPPGVYIESITLRQGNVGLELFREPGIEKENIIWWSELHWPSATANEPMVGDSGSDDIFHIGDIVDEFFAGEDLD